jgi:hypothetical protein
MNCSALSLQVPPGQSQHDNNAPSFTLIHPHSPSFTLIHPHSPSQNVDYSKVLLPWFHVSKLTERGGETYG